MDPQPVTAARKRRVVPKGGGRPLVPGFGVGLLATLGFGVLAFGGVYPWAYWIIAIASAELGLWALAVGRGWNDWRVWRLAKALGIVATAMALQMVPLPPGLFALVSPRASDVLREYEVAYATREHDWHPVSLAPSDSGVAVALFVAFALLLVGTTRALRYEKLDILASRLTLLALVIGLIAIVQKGVTGPDDYLIYGFWRPQYKGEGFGPFVNRNHYAGWAIMMIPLVAARVLMAAERMAAAPPTRTFAVRLASPDSGPALFSAGVVLMVGMSVVLSGSRSGLVSLFVAVAVLGLFVARRIESARMRWALLFGLPLLLTVVMAWAGFDVAARRFEQIPVEISDRVAAWGDTLRIIAAFPVAGVGFGAYAKAMAVYQTAPTHTLFVQAHNDYLQVAAEGGLLVGVPALVALLFVLQGIRRRFQVGDDEPLRFWLRAGAVAGLGGIAVQSLVEFSLQKPGNTVLFVLLLAVAMHRSAGPTPPDAHRR